MNRNLDHPQNATHVMIAGKHEAVLLPSSKSDQRFHQRWWTALPAIPARRDCTAYRRLWRQFADHTMNTFAVNKGIFTPRNRGFYVEGREDHLVPAFFENFALFPDFHWLECLLARLAIPCEGGIITAQWCYSYSELLAEGGRPHADIVVMWQDDSGKAVMAMETKKPGCGRTGFGTKDDPSKGHYLRYKNMRVTDRRYQSLLLDERDLRHLPDEITNTAAVVTWQELVAIQRGEVECLEVSQEIRAFLLARLDAHYTALGLASAQTDHPEGAHAKVTRYAELRALNAPDCVKDWLIGSEFFFAARLPNNILEPPYDWLSPEKTVFDYASQKLQTTREREQPIWLF